MIKIVYNGKNWFASGIDKNGRIELSSSIGGEIETTCTTTEVFSEKANKELIDVLFPNPDKVLQNAITGDFNYA